MRDPLVFVKTVFLLEDLVAVFFLFMLDTLVNALLHLGLINNLAAIGTAGRHSILRPLLLVVLLVLVDPHFDALRVEHVVLVAG